MIAKSGSTKALASNNTPYSSSIGTAVEKYRQQLVDDLSKQSLILTTVMMGMTEMRTVMTKLTVRDYHAIQWSFW